MSDPQHDAKTSLQTVAGLYLDMSETITGYLVRWSIVHALFAFSAACLGTNSSRIAFASNRNGNWDVYLMNADGSNLVNVSNHPERADIGPQWSPDGRQIAFNSDNSVIVADQVGQVIGGFSPESALANNPSWSPSSEMIALHTTIDGNFELYQLRFDGTELTRLTNSSTYDESCPDWSPIGDYIAYRSHHELSAGFDLDLMRADSSGATDSLMTWAGSASDCPLIDWSPDGEHLAVVNRTLSELEIGKSDQSKVLAECARGFPDWSPDGAKITFAGDQCTNNADRTEIYVVNSDGSAMERLTDNSAADYHPVWSPDGRKIAFVSSRDGNDEIYVMNADGSQQTNLTRNSSEDRSPTWQP